MTKQYPVIESNPDVAQAEEQILSFWQENAVFTQSVTDRPNIDSEGKNNEFVFYDGPPFANGLPHYGHLLTGYVKDVFARYQTMKGKKVERRFGWDCHGLPAEMGAEKELGISGRNAITEFGIDKFNDHCQRSVMKYTNEWQEYVTRQARWVDFKHDYKTMDITYMESVMWAFKQLFEKGLVYESYRVMPYSWKCETPLSNFETRMDNAYREVKDKAITVRFKLTDKPNFIDGDYSEYSLLIWTTTPWTLPSNLAAAVGPELDYAVVEKDGHIYILGSFALPHYHKDLGLDENHQPIATIRGKELIGLTYHPVFPYFKDIEHAFQILPAEFVEAGEGTGIVHLAPGFGEDDQMVCAEHDIPVICPVDNAGKFTQDVPDYAGMQVFDANEPIIIKLKQQDSWLKTEQYSHNYPHCWRTDTPLIYKAVPSWYVEVTQFRERMVELNQQINWIPDHVKNGLFGKWLENARDWSISRNRFWGSPIPVWKSDNPEFPRIDVYGSIAELEADFNVKIDNLHRPYIDELTRPNPDDPSGKSTMRRVSDVFDCWFESGSMPFAQVHYPFSNKDWFEAHFPADFIVEYTAQTRGWFYTLMVLGTALFDKPPFLNCICHGVVLDTEGQKLSKRLNNYPDPLALFHEYGADTVRWFMLSSPVMRGGELQIDKEASKVKETLRLAIKPIWNAYHFFTLYANSDGVKASMITKSNDVMDRYILAKMKHAVNTIDDAMLAFDTQTACMAVEQFFEILNNWYIRRNRERFWRSQTNGDTNKQSAYDTIYTVLITMCQAIAPLLPLMTETITAGLTNKGKLETNKSVHLAHFPNVNLFDNEETLCHDMDRVRDVCNTALSIRNQENLRIRLPLQSLTIIAEDSQRLADYTDLIRDELNIKALYFNDDISNHADYVLKLNFPVLGKRLPNKMKQLIAAAKQDKWSQNDQKEVVIEDEILQASEYSLSLVPKANKGAQSLSSNDAVVILDTTLNEALINEGIARDIIRLIQQARKDADLNVSDHISLSLQLPDNIKPAITDFKDYIAEQTLATSVDTENTHDSAHTTTQELEGQPITIGLSVAA